MINVAIVGATGYAGCELARLLLNHDKVNIVELVSKSYVGQKFSDIFPSFRGRLDVKCLDTSLDKLSKKVDLIFTATPQGYLSNLLNEDILKNVKIIDLSADFRLKDVKTYEKWYKITHGSTQFLEEAIYGLCEINRSQINENTRLIANPGCYTTNAILTIYPLLKEGLIDEKTLIIDAKSGVTGAGRGGNVDNLFCEVNENIKAYAISTHRHTPEIEQALSVAINKDITINFTPHLVPMNRGILTTSYASLKENVKKEEVEKAYNKYYENEYFIRLLGENVYPNTKAVRGTNFLDIGYVLDERTNRIIMLGALDNIVKGAAGQAVQNMNILYGFKESLALETIGLQM